MQIVTRDIKKARNYCVVKPRIMRFLKRHAHRQDRRACRIALRGGRNYTSIPRLTGWDIW